MNEVDEGDEGEGDRVSGQRGARRRTTEEAKRHARHRVLLFRCPSVTTFALRGREDASHAVYDERSSGAHRKRSGTFSRFTPSNAALNPSCVITGKRGSRGIEGHVGQRRSPQAPVDGRVGKVDEGGGARRCLFRAVFSTLTKERLTSIGALHTRVWDEMR